HPAGDSAPAADTSPMVVAGPPVSGLAAEPLDAGSPATAVFAPTAVAVYAARAVGSPRNTWPATVIEMGPCAAGIRLRARLERVSAADAVIPEDAVIAATLAADVTASAVADLDLEIGSRVFLAVKATEVRIHRR